MNNQFILSNLKEAEEELRSLIGQIETRKDFSFEEYHAGMAHLYHHLNSAWNGRDASDEERKAYTQETFLKWQKFPGDMWLLL